MPVLSVESCTVLALVGVICLGLCLFGRAVGDYLGRP